uniref:Uncharacterized protein n=1 Tax=Arundo donax TaxID=35708 RepID=A0A0A9HUE8_ARUDO
MCTHDKNEHCFMHIYSSCYMMSQMKFKTLSI